jgi:hypothetical protein
MYFEDVRVKPRETVSGLATDYGYKATEWEKIWRSPKNAGLVSLRRDPAHIQPGDLLNVPIPWKFVTKHLSGQVDGAAIVLERNGELGTRLTFVQTVYQANQPVAGTTPFCVDGCPADDDDPFYWTATEIAGDPDLRKRFSDHSARGAPTAALGTTRWRAVVSLAVVTEKRVTVYQSIVWGWNMTPANVITIVGPREATGHEIMGHINLLRHGKGKTVDFKAVGWTFRSA